jgi:hypothetical protein
MVKKANIIFFIVVLLLISSSSTTKASLLVIEESGKVTWKVLSEQDSVNLEIPTHSYIEVKKAGDSQPNENALVELSKTNGKVNLIVVTGDEKRQVEIGSTNGDLIEIEERPEIQKVNIGVKDGKFSLYQKGISALTDFPIKIDPETAKLTIATESGERFLSILPFQAVQGVLRSKLITRVDGNKLDIIEQERELQYSFSGQKVFNIFNLFEYSVPVSLKVSASTGETVSIEGPVWYKVIGFFLS